MKLEEAIKHVENCYLEILKRPVDPEGKVHYATRICEGAIKAEDLPNILRGSREFKEIGKQTDFKNVLVVVPVRKADKWLPAFRASFEQLNYPRNKMHFAFSLVEPSDHVEQFKKSFSHVNIEIFNDEGTNRFDRLTKTRNRLIDQNLKHQEYIFSIDCDVVQFNPDILDRLIKHDVDVVAPLVIIEGTDQFYDTLAYVHQGRNFSHLSPYCKPCRDKKLFQVDSVGTCYLVKRSVYDSKVKYGNATQKISEQISFCNNARQKGFKVWVDPNITVQHADLPRYGDTFH